MSNLDQIVNELLSVDSDISNCSNKLERECNEITNSINKVQNAFGDQQAGITVATTLYKTLQIIVRANGALNAARQDIKKYAQHLKK